MKKTNIPKSRRFEGERGLALYCVLFFAGCLLLTADCSATTPPKIYGFCVQQTDGKQRSFEDTAALLQEMGFDGGAYELWKPPALTNHLETLDKLHSPIHFLYVAVDVRKPLPEELKKAIILLKDRPIIISPLLRGHAGKDPRGIVPAVTLLREMSDLAAGGKLRFSLYHHKGDYIESMPFSVELVNTIDRPNVGFNFNVCHWLAINGREDYRPLLRSQAKKLFVVLTNGATLGGTSWKELIRPLDEGDFDNAQLFGFLSEIGYDGAIGLMCYGIPGDSRLKLERSMNTWKKLAPLLKNKNIN
jgi:sugar phosphate isomerase/epimerase